MRQKVKQYLKLTGKKQKWIYEQLGVSPSMFSLWLKGERNLGYAELIKIKIIIGADN